MYFANSTSVSSASPVYRAMMDMISSKPIEEQFKLWHYIMRRPYDLTFQEANIRFSNFKKVKKIKTSTKKSWDLQ